MIQDFSKSFAIEEGAVYRRGMGGALSEVAEVVEVGRDRMGIPHVRYNMHLMRGNYVASSAEMRTLALDTFYARYRERVQRG